jgi:hypothetical protein
VVEHVQFAQRCKLLVGEQRSSGGATFCGLARLGQQRRELAVVVGARLREVLRRNDGRCRRRRLGTHGGNEQRDEHEVDGAHGREDEVLATA